MQKHGIYIYLFREKKSRKVIYVGRTRIPMRRFKEHEQALATSTSPLYQYMRDNNLLFYRDIELVLVEFVDSGEADANEREQYYTLLYHDSVLNVHLGDDRSGQWSSRNRAVQCVTDGKIYRSVAEATAHYGITTLYDHLLRGARLKSGLVFKYVDDETVLDAVWAIQCVDDGCKYSSIKHCAEHYNISASILYSKGRDGREFTVGTSGKGNRKGNKLTFIKFVK